MNGEAGLVAEGAGKGEERRVGAGVRLDESVCRVAGDGEPWVGESLVGDGDTGEV